MSDQLRIAGVLRKLNDDQLVALAKRRKVNTTNLRDFFDFAEQLANEKSIRLALATLHSAALNQLLNTEDQRLVKGHATEPALAELLLVDPFTGIAFDSVKRVCHDMPLSAPASVPIRSSEHSIDEIDRDARMCVFDLLQAITEVVLDLEQRFIREVGKRSVGLPEVKRLATHLTKDVAYAKQVFELVLWSQVATIENARWQLGPNSARWLDSSDEDRWALLADHWVQLANPQALSGHTAIPAGESFFERYQLVYLQRAPETIAHIDQVVRVAEAIGLTHDGFATSWFETLMRKDVGQAAKQMAGGLPQTDRRLIVQADLSLIAPNPLPTAVEVELRSFVETEKIGLASLYRLSVLSVSTGLESGVTVERIRELLEELSGKALPQPVEYLLADAQRKFGKIRISQDAALNRSKVQSEDRVTLTALYNDIKLKPLSLHVDESGQLLSRFDADVVYFSLRDAGHVVVRVDENQNIISPRSIATPHAAIDTDARLRGDVLRMREADHKIGNEPDDDDLVRQLQLAIKLKSKISVTLDTGSGKKVVYQVEPTGLSNGRLRAKDRKADVERTLPLSAIVSIDLV